MKKVKKGSSLISIVIVFSLLVIACTTLMFAIVNGYKFRITNNTRVKNLYASESGLEKSYANVSNLIDKSIEEANKAVEQYNKTILAKCLDEARLALDAYIDRKIEALKNKLPFNEGWDNYYMNQDGSLKEENIYIERNKVFKAAYKGFIEEQIKEKTEIGEASDSFNVKIVGNSPKFDTSDKLSFDLKSQFQSKDINRILQTTLNITTPEYNKQQNYKTLNIPIKKVWTKAFVAGGDFIDRGKVFIDGDLYVFGDKGSKKGIVLEKDSNLTLKGNVMSLKDITLNGQSAKLNILNNGSREEDISNVFTGSLAIESFENGTVASKVENAHINIDGKVYSNNDLVLNGVKSTINISKGFYGVNDKKDSTDKEGQLKNSSSMIVNSDDLGKGSSITIGEEAIFMGTAYINVSPSYQTGESVAIKGNYRAYGAPLKDETYKEGKMIFEYRDPLQLVTKFKDVNEPLLFNEKEEYLEKYIDEYKGLNINNGKGIILPNNTSSVAAAFSEAFGGGNFRSGNSLKAVEAVNKHKERYDNAKQELKPLNEEIEFSKLSYEKDGDETIYLSNSTDACTLFGEGKDIIVTTSKSKKLGTKGMIITNGDIYIKGKIDRFKGTIITSGNIIVEGNEEKNFIYDGNYIKKFVATNYALLEGVFKGNDLANQVIKWTQDENGTNNETDTYLRHNLLISKNWRIIK